MSHGRFKIVIVGGGSAGWMTAATLAKTCPNKDITVIESPNVPTVGVGESTIGQINKWLGLMGIKDEEFMRACDATYKLSIRFQDFYKKGGGHFHYPFGTAELRGTIAGMNDWILNRILEGNTEPTHTYAEWFYRNMLLVNNNKMTDNKDGKFVGFDFRRDVAYHFDATKFGLFLKSNYVLNKGVKYIAGDVTDTLVDKNGIKEVMVNGHQPISADLFIDCTGFKSLLLGKALEEPFESYEDILPNNSAVATKVPYRNHKKQMVPYTNCVAYDNGWIWEIPLWSRIGAGYVYCDKYISDEQAITDLKEYLKKNNHTIDNSEFKTIKMRVGIHQRPFVKNVCAIGLAAGFIEPLESNGLYTVHEFLLQLVRILQRDTVSRFDRDAFNFKCKELFRNFAECVGLHYALTQRDDTQYWRDIQEREYCKGLYTGEPTIYNGFMSAANKRFNHFFYGASESGGLDCIAHGMHWFPTDSMSLVAARFGEDMEILHAGWKRAKKTIFKINHRQLQLVKKMPTYYEFLANRIYKGGNIASIKFSSKKK